MPKLFQIAIEANINSVGRIAEQIGLAAMERGWESYLTYSRSCLESQSNLIKIGSRLDIYRHVVMTRLFDRHCLHSTASTKELIQKIEEVDPDVIQLHHIHGYFIDMEVLFDYLSRAGKPVVWVFHDCWAFTGHCAHFDCGTHECNRWQSECHDCPLKREYPASFFADRSRENFKLKKQLFNSVPNMTIVSVSEWMNSLVEKSFLNGNRLMCIPNGIDTQLFCPRDNRSDTCRKYGIDPDNRYVIGVASTWTLSKGFKDFIKLRTILPTGIQIVMVGLAPTQLKELPDGIIGLRKTDNVDDLASLYSGADVFVNPTHHDTFPTVNIEAQSCGTPVVTYNSGGAPEIVDHGKTGLVVECGNIKALADAIQHIIDMWKSDITAQSCRQRVETLYDRKKNFNQYIDLYDRLLNNSYK